MMKLLAKPAVLLTLLALIAILSGFALAMAGKVDGGEALKTIGGPVFGALIGFFAGRVKGGGE